MSLNIVVGLSGVGKSTVLEEAMLLADQDYEIVNYGDKMMEVAGSEVETRDQLKEIEMEEFKEIQREAAEQVFDLAREEDVILDTHAAIQSTHGYIPGLPRWSIEELNPDKIIMLTARSEEIWNRVKDDDDRDREHDSEGSIAEYQHISREMAATGSVLTGAYLKVIENPDGKAEKAAEELVRTLKA
ncbi:MAG: adenylate kinase [Candidatus Nanohaloarchaea archaeon]